MLITEALADLKTIERRISKKQDFICGFLARQETMKDPLAGEGGSAESIKEQRQAIGDLSQRAVDLRLSINAINASTKVTVNGDTKTIAEWIIWRRDISASETRFLNKMQTDIQNVRANAQKQGLQVIASGEKSSNNTDVVINIDEKALANEIEHIETVLGELDGKLSVINATTTI